jgi:hypothetical protein
LVRFDIRQFFGDLNRDENGPMMASRSGLRVVK